MTAAQRLAAIRKAAAEKQTRQRAWEKAIREAAEAGIPKARIAEAAGVSRPTLYLLLHKIAPNTVQRYYES